MSFFVAGATCGDAGVLMFAAGAASGEIWIDSWSANTLYFCIQNLLTTGESKLCERTGFSFANHGRIGS